MRRAGGSRVELSGTRRDFCHQKHIKGIRKKIQPQRNHDVAHPCCQAQGCHPFHTWGNNERSLAWGKQTTRLPGSEALLCAPWCARWRVHTPSISPALRSHSPTSRPPADASWMSSLLWALTGSGKASSGSEMTYAYLSQSVYHLGSR